MGDMLGKENVPPKSTFDAKQNLGDLVNLVDVEGNVISVATKLDAHSGEGQLHLAFSIFLFTKDSKKILLQKRASHKYHFPGKWANACCSHPRPGEELIDAAQRRLSEELGLQVPLQKIGSFIYRARCEQSALVEYEFDHVFVGIVSENALSGLSPDKAEIEDMALVDYGLLSEGNGFSVGKSMLLGKKYLILHGEMAPWLLPAFGVCEKNIKDFLVI